MSWRSEKTKCALACCYKSLNDQVDVYEKNGTYWIFDIAVWSACSCVAYLAIQLKHFQEKIPFIWDTIEYQAGVHHRRYFSYKDVLVQGKFREEIFEGIFLENKFKWLLTQFGRQKFLPRKVEKIVYLTSKVLLNMEK